VARIDTPRVDEFLVAFFNQIIFDTPQLELFQFISRRPTLRAPEKSHIAFHSQAIIVKNSHHRHRTTMYSACKSHAWRQNGRFHPLIRTSPCLPLLRWRSSSSLRIEETHHISKTMSKMLELLNSFSSVKILYLCEKIVPRIEEQITVTSENHRCMRMYMGSVS
jgi:hypothetical protein